MGQASQPLAWRSYWSSLSSRRPLLLLCHQPQCKHTGTPNERSRKNSFPKRSLSELIKPFSRLENTVQPIWHQRIELDIEGKHEDLVGLDLMAGELDQLVKRVKEEGAGKVVVGGFSMGAHTALHAVYRGGVQVDACLALSSYLIRSSAVYEYLDDDRHAKAPPPLLMCHGLSDVTVPPSWADETGLALKKRGVDVKLKFYEGLAHQPAGKMIKDAFSWVQQLQC